MPSSNPIANDASLPVLDREAALERLGGDENMLEEFLGLLLEQAASDVPQIDQAIQAGDIDQLQHLAHSLKGAAASLNAERIRETAYQLETMGQTGDLAEAPAALTRLQNEVQRLQEYAKA